MTKKHIKELSIQVHLNGLSFCILNRSSNTIEFIKTIDFERKLNPSDVLKHLQTALSQNTVFSDDFDSILVIHQNELATLVPKSLYSENHKADYLKFNTKILRTDFISEDQVKLNDSVNVYVPYVNINNYIFETFGEFVYKHASTILVNSILEKTSKNSELKEVFINVNSSSIEIVVIEKKKLLLFNVFEYSSKEDFIYYILFVFEQLKLDTEKTLVYLSGNVSKNDEIYSILYTYVRHIDFIDLNLPFEISNKIEFKVPHHHYLILNSF